jgi:hypothetical protein
MMDAGILYLIGMVIVFVFFGWIAWLGMRD